MGPAIPPPPPGGGGGTHTLKHFAPFCHGEWSANHVGDKISPPICCHVVLYYDWHNSLDATTANADLNYKTSKSHIIVLINICVNKSVYNAAGLDEQMIFKMSVWMKRRQVHVCHVENQGDFKFNIGLSFTGDYSHLGTFSINGEWVCGGLFAVSGEIWTHRSRTHSAESARPLRVILDSVGLSLNTKSSVVINAL